MMFRTSRLLKFGPHALYAERRNSGTWRIVSYVPRDPIRRICPPPFFSGRSKWGDLHE